MATKTVIHISLFITELGTTRLYHVYPAAWTIWLEVSLSVHHGAQIFSTKSVPTCLVYYRFGQKCPTCPGQFRGWKIWFVTSVLPGHFTRVDIIGWPEVSSPVTLPGWTELAGHKCPPSYINKDGQFWQDTSVLPPKGGQFWQDTSVLPPTSTRLDSSGRTQVSSLLRVVSSGRTQVSSSYIYKDWQFWQDTSVLPFGMWKDMQPFFEQGGQILREDRWWQMM